MGVVGVKHRHQNGVIQLQCLRLTVAVAIAPATPAAPENSTVRAHQPEPRGSFHTESLHPHNHHHADKRESKLHQHTGRVVLTHLPSFNWVSWRPSRLCSASSIRGASGAVTFSRGFSTAAAARGRIGRTEVSLGLASFRKRAAQFRIREHDRVMMTQQGPHLAISVSSSPLYSSIQGCSLLQPRQ